MPKSQIYFMLMFATAFGLLLTPMTMLWLFSSLVILFVCSIVLTVMELIEENRK